MNLIKSLFLGVTTKNLQQIRTTYVNHWMYRDAERRKTVKQYAPTRLRLKALYKNDVLPPEFRSVVGEEFHALPRRSNRAQLTDRCVLTSRPRGTVYRWRISRIMFRHLTDYNKMSGLQRAMW